MSLDLGLELVFRVVSARVGADHVDRAILRGGKDRTRIFVIPKRVGAGGTRHPGDFSSRGRIDRQHRRPHGDVKMIRFSVERHAGGLRGVQAKTMRHSIAGIQSNDFSRAAVRAHINQIALAVEAQAGGISAQRDFAGLPALEIDRRQCLVARQADVKRVALRNQQQSIGLGGKLDRVQNLPIAAGDNGDCIVAGIGHIEPLLLRIHRQAARGVQVFYLGDHAPARRVENVERIGGGVSYEQELSRECHRIKARPAGDFHNGDLPKLRGRGCRQQHRDRKTRQYSGKTHGTAWV